MSGAAAQLSSTTSLAKHSNPLDRLQLQVEGCFFGSISTAERLNFYIGRLGPQRTLS